MTGTDLFGDEKRLSVLVIEDDDGDAGLIREALDGAPGDRLELTRVVRLEEAFPLLGRGVDVILLDLMLPDSRGLETLRRVRDRVPDVPVVVLSGLDDEEVAIDAVRNGAQDYIAKGHAGLKMLPRVVRYAVERNHAERQLIRIKSLESEMAERRQAEERLRHSQNQLAKAQRIAHVGSWDWDIAANRVTWSDETYRIFGRTARDFDGSYESVLQAIHPDDRAVMHRAVAQAYETHHPYELMHRVIRPDGSIRHVHARGETVTDDAGAVIRMVGTCQDVTEVTLAIEAARQQNAFIALLQKVSSAANSAARVEDLLKLSLPEIRNASGADVAAAVVFGEANRPAVFFADAAPGAAGPDVEPMRKAELESPLTARILQSGKPEWSFDALEIRAAGAASAIGFPILIGATPVGVVGLYSTGRFDPSGTLIDVLGQIGIQLGRVVERRQAEDELRVAHAALESRVGERTRELSRANAELKRSNADLEQLAFIASHDLTEPLRRMHAFSDLLGAVSRDWMDSKARHYVSKIQESARRTSRLLESLLQYSRIAPSSARPEPFSLEEAVRDAARSMESGLHGADLHVDALPAVSADRHQMRELFRHLLDNAAKFRADRPLTVRIGARRDGDGWSVWVRDNGIGIEPPYHERVFAIFQRLHTRAAYPGNGIGLAICKKIVEGHGGQIWIESDGRAGTGVVFRLPERPREPTLTTTRNS